MGLLKETPETYAVNDKQLKCQVCESTQFYKRTATLHGAAASWFNLEWASPSCTCLICSDCGYVHWFLPR